MQSVRRIEHHSRRAGAGKRGGDFCADVPGFSNADHDHFSPRVHSFPDQFDSTREIFAQPLPEPLELKNFYVQDTSGLFKVVHRTI